MEQRATGTGDVQVVDSGDSGGPNWSKVGKPVECKTLCDGDSGAPNLHIGVDNWPEALVLSSLVVCFTIYRMYKLELGRQK